MTGDKGQVIEDREQGTGDRGQKTERRKQKAEGRSSVLCPLSSVTSVQTRRLLRATVLRAGYGVWHRHRRPDGVRILMYHRVNDERPQDDLTVTPRRFAEQMAALAEGGWNVVPLEAAVRWLAGEEAVPTPAVVLTFDDGYADNYRHAFPVLERHRFPATVFVASGFIGTDQRMPRYAAGGADDRMMTWEEVRALSASGLIEIGAHTVTHRELPGLDADTAGEEIVASKRQVEAAVGRRVTAFAYPRGAVNDSVRRLVEEAGFEAACTVRGGWNRPGADRLLLRRTGISGHDSLEDFRMKVAGAFDWLHRFVEV